MLLVLFATHQEQFATDGTAITEILPLVHLARVANGPEYLSGLMNYRGQAVPVIDLCELLDKKKCKERMSSRIMVVNYALDHDQHKLVGLLAEQITETVHCKQPDRGKFLLELPSLVHGSDETQMFQWFDIEKYLPVDTVTTIFQLMNEL